MMKQFLSFIMLLPTCIQTADQKGAVIFQEGYCLQSPLVIPVGGGSVAVKNSDAIVQTLKRFGTFEQQGYTLREHYLRPGTVYIMYTITSRIKNAIKYQTADKPDIWIDEITIKSCYSKFESCPTKNSRYI